MRLRTSAISRSSAAKRAASSIADTTALGATAGAWWPAARDRCSNDRSARVNSSTGIFLRQQQLADTLQHTHRALKEIVLALAADAIARRHRAH